MRAEHGRSTLSDESDVLSVANQNGKGFSFGSTNQNNLRTKTIVLSVAGSNSGLNSQFGMSGSSVNKMHTGDAGSVSTVASWANINLSGMSIE